MKLKTTLLGKTYLFKDLKEVLAKANEEKTGDKLAGLAAETAQERVAAKVVLSALTLADLRENPAVPYEEDEVTRIIQDDVNIPLVWQFLILEFAIDGLKLAAVNTPSMLSTPLSVVAAIVLGEFAVKSGWFNSEVLCL